ncbi:MAG: hypothetical protein OQL19_15545 [Gammaproteobacteria bacterium]|nr:hypothetical protein [Gammaproteobacteria bacterium]
MMHFILQYFQKNNNRMFLKHNGLLFLFIAISLFSTPLYAQSNYLFPSDIIDQTEQSQYELGREARYAEQRQWVYPQVRQSSGNKPVYPGSNQNKPRQYQNFQNQSEQIRTYENSDWVEESDHYKYDNFELNNSQSSFQTQKDHYGNAQQPDSFSGGSFYASDHNTKPIAQQKYGTRDSSYYSNVRSSESNHPSNKLLYPSDLEVNRNLTNYNGYHSYNNQGQQFAQKQNNVQIQYVPVPVYRVPGTLPGTIPGVVTPGNMVPGYSHLSPNSSHGSFNSDIYNQGISSQNFLHQNYRSSKRLRDSVPTSVKLNKRNISNNPMAPFMGGQLNPLDEMGFFPGGSTPFDTFYKTYDNYSTSTNPFAMPESMIPGLSMPSLFSSQ